jgi:hypothetical protein
MNYETCVFHRFAPFIYVACLQLTAQIILLCFFVKNKIYITLPNFAIYKKKYSFVLFFRIMSDR